MRAAEIREGMVIDLAPAVDAYGAPDIDPTDDEKLFNLAHYEYAMADADAQPVEPVSGMPAVLITTDQGNYKLPADFDLPFINWDGGSDD